MNVNINQSDNPLLQGLSQSQGQPAETPRPFNEPTKADGSELSVRDLMKVKKMQLRDGEIRAHEQAHMSAAGQYLQSGAVFEYQRGPDGKLYAVHGEVVVDSANELSPMDTIAKMRVVRRAALAPQAPSPADMKIAAKASANMAKAAQKLSFQKLGELQNSKKALEASLKREEAVLESTQGEGMILETSGSESESDKPKVDKISTTNFKSSLLARYMGDIVKYQNGGVNILI